MATQVKLDFVGWTRSAIYSAVPSAVLSPEGRLRGHVDVTLRNQLPPGDTVSHTIDFDVVGPGDILGLKAGTVLHTVPPPGTIDFEETKCVYVELSGVDLPWRYTPELAVGRKLRPWLVLVVGTESEVELNTSGTVTLQNDVLAAHDLSLSARWAHVQDDVAHPGERMVTRLLSPRNLEPRTPYVAVVVPAFNAVGVQAWNAATPSVTLPAFHSWSFITAEEGDFPTLAARLKAGLADPDLGRAQIAYTPLEPDALMTGRGALAPIGSADLAVATDVAADVAELTIPVVDPLRPVVGLPDYGAAWTDDSGATEWGAAFLEDPRARGIGGLGLRAGIEEQDLLADAAAKQAGALDEAAQRIRHLTAGLGSARSLWARRLPTDPIRRLAVFGPALGRMVTDTGTVLRRVAGGDRPLPPALFSSAARRALRQGPARTAGAAKGAADPALILVKANACPKPPERAPKGLVHADDLADETGIRNIDDAVCKGVGAGRVPVERLEKLIDGFDRSPYRPGTIALFDQIMRILLERAHSGKPIPLLDMLAILDPPTGKPLNDRELLVALRLLLGEKGQADTDSLLDLGATLCIGPPERPCRPVDLDALATAVADAIDPTGDHPFMVDRVISGIVGLDDQPLTPPELCPDLDIPAWQFLRDHNSNWLLPGAGTLEENDVVAVETNPTFVDAFLLGVNTQIVSELRFRNIPIRSRCTPLRQFWARTNPATETYDDDIRGVHLWPDSSPLGSITHQTPAAASADLVIVFRTPLFRRYPQTLVYLTPAPLVGGTPDWTAEPVFTNRLVPSFQGAITPDIVFFGFDLDPSLGRRYWVVLEEPPHGFQFFSGPVEGMSAARREVFTKPLLHNDGAAFGDAAFADPFRVMIRGQSLIPVVP